VKSAKATKQAPPARNNAAQTALALAAGSWLGISLLKFGNPVIFDSLIAAPRQLAEFVFLPWPVAWGYVLLAVVAALAFRVAKPHLTRADWPMAAALVWLAWQFFSSARSIDPKLSQPALLHFTAAVVSLFVGWWALARVPNLRWFWIPLMAAFAYALMNGFDQQHGGLEAARQEFYKTPSWELYPAEYKARMQSNRIFSTLVYPNAFAGVILLLLPVVLYKTWEIASAWPRVAGGVALGLLGYLGVGCLYWTGSKGGWLIALGACLTILLHLRLPRSWKAALVAASLVAGLGFFFVRFSGYFQKGATSVSARFIYWEAAWATAKDNPVLGSGPATFQAAYRKIKPPEAEMAKLAHNDYLEQASDSGFPGAIAYVAFVFGSLCILYRQRPSGNWVFLLVWIGLASWTAQGFIEFGLYIPALAWPAFCLFGLLWGQKIRPSGDSITI
jgi:hypothetical protein